MLGGGQEGFGPGSGPSWGVWWLRGGYAFQERRILACAHQQEATPFRTWIDADFLAVSVKNGWLGRMTNQTLNEPDP